jgi:hypothetical protein
MYELEPQYDSRASFYGKAQVTAEHTIIDSEELKLYSYGTLVASVEHTNLKTIFRYNGYYSQTTTRHQKEFFFQEGLHQKDWELLKKQGTITYAENGDVLDGNL